MHTCYSPVRRSPSGGVATSHAAPRLACVKPVASVHPEPGSNSSLCIIVFSFFSEQRRHPTDSPPAPLCVNASLAPRLPPPRAHPKRGAGAGRRAEFTCHSRNLDRRSAESPSLSLTCLSDFLIANISMISLRKPPGHSDAT